MRVEQYSEKYHEDLILLVDKFSTEYVSLFDPDYSKLSVEDTISKFPKELIFLLVDGGQAVGVIAGISVPNRYNTKKLYEEILWYVEPNHGKYAFWFVEQVEKKVKAMGFSGLIMSVLNSPKGEKIKRIYEKIGYQYLESHYIKNL